MRHKPSTVKTMFQNHLKIAWRSLIKNKITGFINIVGLAIGMAVAMMIGLWLHDELNYNKYHENYETLAQVYLHQTFNGKTGTSQALSLPYAPHLREEYGSDIEEVALASWPRDFLIAVDDKRFLKNGRYVEPNFPKMFSLEMVVGNHEDALTKPHSIIIAASVANALFGDADAMGKTVKFNSTHDLEITGVFKDLPMNTNFGDHKAFTTYALYEETTSWVLPSSDNWGNHSFPLFVQIKPHADFAAISEKFKHVERITNPNGDPEAFLHPMSKWHLYSQFKNGINVGGRIQFIWLFGIIGVFVLLLACINFMNLSTARSEKRSKEVGIRKSIGSLRGQLIGQFLTESLLVTGLALVLSLMFVQMSLTWFNNLADKELVIPLGNPIFWLSVGGFTVFTGLIAGSYPAFYLSSFNPITALKGTFKAGRWASVPRQFLVTLQFTVSIALIIGTIVVFQQIQHAKNRPIGYERDSMIQFFNNEELDGKDELLRDELLKTGVVEEMGTSSSPITGIWSNQIGFEWDGKDPNFLPSFGVVAVSQEFGSTVDWEILKGRDFSRQFATDSTALILNESAVELTGLDEVVGKTIRWGEQDCHVVGIVKDMLMESPWNPVKPTIFHVNPTWTNIFTVKLKKGVPVKDALAKVEGVYAKLSPSSPFDYTFTDDEYDEKFRQEERIGKLARVFAILAIFISCLGLFGLSVFVAEQRTKEIGIRKVLGASVTNLWALQSKSFMILVFMSCFIAIPLAWYYLEGWLAGYDYRITLNWSVFVIAAVLAMAVTLITVSFQSLKAAMMNPVESISSD